MILNGKKTINFTVNYLADLVLNEIPKKHNTIIEVIDVGNFFLFKGKTDYEETLDLFSILAKSLSDNFKDNFSKKISHVVDLIEYGVNPEKNKSNRFLLFNSENSCYHQSQIDFFKITDTESTDFDYSLIKISNNLSCKSNFPFGHSFSQNRGRFMYSKFMVNHIPPTYPFSSLIIEFPESERDFENISIFDTHTKDYDENLKSAFLDYFDFNFESFRKNFEEIETGYELKNPTLELDLCKRRVENFLII